MIELGLAAPVAAPPLSPAEPAIDLCHLSRMTLGERELEREVLRLFALQSDLLLEKMRHTAPVVVGAHAHTLKGSARGIGAWKVAHAAEEVERAAQAGDLVGLARALGGLRLAVGEARAAIADLLRG
jgi:hypothetical protein